jgi:hypothetical protein
VPPSERLNKKSGLKPTRRRNRKPETLAFLRRAWTGEFADFEVPDEYRTVPRRGYKFLAAALTYRAGSLEWAGQNRSVNDVAILRRVAWELPGARRDASGETAVRYDLVHAEIRALLEVHALRWDVASQRYLVHKAVRQRREALEAEPEFAPFVRTARAQLEQEFSGKPIRGWSPGGVQVRAQQLRRELAEGRQRQPLDARLRDLVRNARERGELPRERPPGSART